MDQWKNSDVQKHVVQVEWLSLYGVHHRDVILSVRDQLDSLEIGVFYSILQKRLIEILREPHQKSVEKHANAARMRLEPTQERIDAVSNDVSSQPAQKRLRNAESEVDILPWESTHLINPNSFAAVPWELSRKVRLSYCLDKEFALFNEHKLDEPKFITLHEGDIRSAYSIGQVTIPIDIDVEITMWVYRVEADPSYGSESEDDAVVVSSSPFAPRVFSMLQFSDTVRSKFEGTGIVADIDYNDPYCYYLLAGGRKYPIGHTLPGESLAHMYIRPFVPPDRRSDGKTRLIMGIFEA